MVLPDSTDSFNDLSRQARDPSINELFNLETHSNAGTENYKEFFTNESTFPQNETLSAVTNVCPMEVDAYKSEDSVFKITSTLNCDVSKNSQDSEAPTVSSDADRSSPQSDCLPCPKRKKLKQLTLLDSYAVARSSVPAVTKTLKVQCLQDTDSLKKICESQGLIFNEDPVYDDSEDSDEDSTDFEVDMIFAHRIMDKKTYYHIKWKNYSSEQNTWEPSSNLQGCKEMIKYYCAMQGSKSTVNMQLLNYFVRDLISRKPYDILTMTKACALCFGSSEKYVTSLKLTVSQMKVKIKEILTFSPRKLIKLKSQLFEIMRFGEARKQVLINLKEWQSHINSVTKTAYIEVENNVDLETAPTDFTFINDYINSVVTMPEEPLTFCNCDDCFKEKQRCCPHDSEGYFAYNRYQRLILEPGYPIFECNRKCRCDSSCTNRVVQHGQKVKVSIFRTSNGCGWGLKTLETIEKGQFVLEYLGEIITSEEAETRGHIYDYVGRSYLFDLDYGVENAACNYTVDAGHVGNAAHFINHSCDPNLHVFAVWINQPDPNLPRLAFFAKRKISRGEELTFDYKMEENVRFNAQESEKLRERILCRCDSKNCRKFLF